jgi:WD40 repeat protein
MDWSSKNILCVALHNEVYTWDPVKKLPRKILSLVNNVIFESLNDTMDYLSYVTSVKWSDDGNLLAIGTSNSKIILWDSMTEKRVSLIHDHNSRVPSLAWNSSLLTSGSKDGSILNHDIRTSNRSAVSSYLMHKGEVCGLKWSENGRYLCSGSGSNVIFYFKMIILIIY